MDEKIELIKSISTDDATFIMNVCDAYRKNIKNYEAEKEKTDIVIDAEKSDKVIDLDMLWAKPYFYTSMRLRLEGIVKAVLDATRDEIVNDSTAFCDKAIFNDYNVKTDMKNGQKDIVEFIQELDKNGMKYAESEYQFTARKIDEETLFKEKWLKCAFIVMAEKDIKKRNGLVYDMIYEYLKDDFVANNYCDFKDNKCVSQRNNQPYPYGKKNGCCSKRFGYCKHLKTGGACDIECLSCRLFSCPYLSSRGIGYYFSEFILVKAFYTRWQRVNAVNSFYTPRKNLLRRINLFVGAAYHAPRK